MIKEIIQSKPEYDHLIASVGALLEKARKKAYFQINQILVKTYWEIGKRIVEYEQKGEEKARYGSKLLDNLSKDLTKQYKKGFSRDNLEKMRKFYLTFPNPETLSRKLSWSHYCELMKIRDEKKRVYFEKYVSQEDLSVRDLKRQIYSLHYERLLMSKNKKSLIKHETEKLIPSKAEELIKDPYVLEFLDLDEKHEYTEKELESKILDELQKFLLELGQGFSFVTRQKRFTIDNDHFYIDLLFYNIYLKCYVVIELKVGKFKHEDVGQLNFYLNYVKKELNREGDYAPIGIILCTEKNKVHAEFALAGLSNKLFVSKYKLYLPDKKELEARLGEMLK